MHHRLSLYTKTNQILFDMAIGAAAWAGAWIIRYNGMIPPTATRQMLVLLIPVAAGQIGINALFVFTSFNGGT